MTNNSKVSLDRELLEKLTEEGRVSEISDAEWSELRALLDKPAECRCKRYGKDNPHWPCPVHAEPAAQHQGEPVAWRYCPECGSEELHHEEGEHKQCANCHQEWFSDIDYSEVVRGNLQKLKAEQPAPVAVVMPERKTKADYSGYIEQFQSEAAGLYNSALDDVA